MSQSKPASLEEVRDELHIANRLMILSLVRNGIQQKDIAATLGVNSSVVSEMFPKGLLKRVGQLSKGTSRSDE